MIKMMIVDNIGTNSSDSIKMQPRACDGQSTHRITHIIANPEIAHRTANRSTHRIAKLPN